MVKRSVEHVYYNVTITCAVCRATPSCENSCTRTIMAVVSGMPAGQPPTALHCGCPQCAAVLGCAPVPAGLPLLPSLHSPPSSPRSAAAPSGHRRLRRPRRRQNRSRQRCGQVESSPCPGSLRTHGQYLRAVPPHQATTSPACATHTSFRNASSEITETLLHRSQRRSFRSSNPGDRVECWRWTRAVGSRRAFPREVTPAPVAAISPFNKLCGTILHRF